MRIFENIRLTPLLLILLVLSACSPYVYEKEVTIFREGVEKSAQSILELKQKRIAHLETKRDKDLDVSKKPIDFSEGCDKLRKEYLNSVSEGSSIPVDSYSDCYATPKGKSTDPNISNIVALSTGLTAYSAALVNITNASDQNELQQAFSEFNNSTKKMLESINKKLDDKNEAKYNAISGLVFSIGNVVLNQMRFNALKTGVNQADPMVAKASELLEEAAFYLHEKEVNREYSAMLKYAQTANPANDYLASWKNMDQKAEKYVLTIKNSPVHAFKALASAHVALKKSLNDPGNQAQLNAVLENANAFKDSADAALDTFK